VSTLATEHAGRTSEQIADKATRQARARGKWVAPIAPPTETAKTPDLLALADALDRLADEATPGPWALDAEVVSHMRAVVAPGREATPGDFFLADVPEDKPGNARLVAAAPSLARSLAATLRAVAAHHKKTVTGVTLADGLRGDICGAHHPYNPMWPCAEAAAVLTAVEPLLPLLGAGAQ